MNNSSSVGYLKCNCIPILNYRDAIKKFNNLKITEMTLSRNKISLKLPKRVVEEKLEAVSPAQCKP